MESKHADEKAQPSGESWAATAPAPRASKAKARLHPAINLEQWVADYDAQETAARLSQELTARGLVDAAHIRKSPMQVLPALIAALKLDVATVLSLVDEEKQDNG